MLQNVRPAPVHRPAFKAWLPLAALIAVICLESTNRMASANTARWMMHILHLSGPVPTMVETINKGLRKCGHVLGYGLLGLGFAYVWPFLLQRGGRRTWLQLRMHAGMLGAISATLVGCCDEWHQSFLPARSASWHDVLIDASGALALNLLVIGLGVRRRTARVAHPQVLTLGLTPVHGSA